MKTNLMQIGEIAKTVGINIQTIRYYERRGILKPADKLESGYRLYTKEAIKTVKFIKHAQELGFSLDEIRDLMRLRAPSTGRCDGVRKRAVQKLEDVRGKISMLQGIETSLKKLITDCEQNKTSQKCPIIESMEGTT